MTAKAPQMHLLLLSPETQFMNEIVGFFVIFGFLIQILKKVHLDLRFEAVRKNRKEGIHVGWRVLTKRKKPS